MKSCSTSLDNRLITQSGWPCFLLQLLQVECGWKHTLALTGTCCQVVLLDDAIVLPSSNTVVHARNSFWTPRSEVAVIDSLKFGVNLYHEVRLAFWQTGVRKEKPWCMLPRDALLCLCVTVEGDLFAWGWGGSQGTHGVDGLSSGGQLVRTVPYPLWSVQMQSSLVHIKIQSCT